MTELNYSFSMGGQTKEPPPSALFSFHGIKAVAGPESTILLFNPRTHQKLMVQPDVAGALRHCNQFRTLEDHAKRLTKVVTSLREHPEIALQTLETVRDAGMLESAETAWNRLATESAIEPAPCRIFILTCDRPDALDRLLTSLVKRPLPVEAEGIWVIDDSRGKPSIERNAQIIREHQASLGIDVIHYDLEARNRLIAHLKRVLGEHHSSVDFLLSRNQWNETATYGLARNLALLLSVGKRALVLDDDVVAEAIAPPAAPKDLRFGSANDREAILYPSREALTGQRLTLDESPLALMISELGQPLANALKRSWRSPSDLFGLDGAQSSRFGSQSRVLLTQCGSWGDPGSIGNSWIHYLPSASLQRLLESSHELGDLLAARCVWMGYRGPTLTEHGTMSQLTAIDHTSLLPPYLPAGRGEDILFALMLQRLHPESVVWNAGWSIPHLPVDTRSPSTELAPLEVQIGVDTLAEWLGSEPRDQWGLSPERRLLGLAEEIQRLADMNISALNALVAEEQLSRTGATLGRIMRQLATIPASGRPANLTCWRTFLEASRDRLLAQIQAVETDPLEAVSNAFGGDGMIALRHLGRGWSRAVATWPAICEAARAFE